MATVFMSERLLKAAVALAAQGERVEVGYVGYGNWVDCFFIGAGSKTGTVRLAIWCSAGEILREGSRPIRFFDCLVPVVTLARLEMVARAQEAASPSMAAAREFIGRAQRTRDGRFADCTHRAEKAGV